jgi:hypothetical protein
MGVVWPGSGPSARRPGILSAAPSVERSRAGARYPTVFLFAELPMTRTRALGRGRDVLKSLKTHLKNQV